MDQSGDAPSSSMGGGSGGDLLPSHPGRSMEASPTIVPRKYVPLSGRVSRAKKGTPVHICESCYPPKTFTRAEHLRRHQLSHQQLRFPCDMCDRAFHRLDLLARHKRRHGQDGGDQGAQGGTSRMLNGWVAAATGAPTFPHMALSSEAYSIEGKESRSIFATTGGIEETINQEAISQAKPDTPTFEEPFPGVFKGSLATEGSYADDIGEDGHVIDGSKTYSSNALPLVEGKANVSEKTGSDVQVEAFGSASTAKNNRGHFPSWKRSVGGDGGGYGVMLSQSTRLYYPALFPPELTQSTDYTPYTPLGLSENSDPMLGEQPLQQSKWQYDPQNSLEWQIDPDHIVPAFSNTSRAERDNFRLSVAPTDSGYGSTTHSRLEESVVEAMHTESHSDDARMPSKQASTEYSSASSIQNISGLTRYITEFAEELSTMFPTTLPIAELSRLSSTLPPLLKAFAIKLGSCDPSPSARNLMFLVHKYRHQITRALLNFFAFEGSREISPVPSTDTMPLETLMALWDRQREHESSRQIAVREIWEGGDLDEYGLEPDDEFPDLHQYREVLINSPAYSWLSSTLAAEVSFDSPWEGARTIIGGQIFSMLESMSKTTVSRHLAPTTSRVEFAVPWTMGEFFDFQEYDIPAHEALPRVFVLVGTGNNVQYSTVLDYASKLWPFYGPELVAFYQAILRGGKECNSTCVLADDTSICIKEYSQLQHQSRDSKEILFSVTGTIYAIAEVGEILAWLHAALTLTDHKNGMSDRALREFKAAEQYMPTTTKTSFAHGGCWKDIIGDMMCLRGYPNLRRPMHNTGMELSLDAMLALVNARKLMTFKGTFCIKGYCSIVVPTDRQENIIYWHLATNKDGSYMAYTGPENGENEFGKEFQFLKGLSLRELETCRHVLGWTSNAQNLAAANYNVGWSGLSEPRAGCAFEKVSIVGGQFVTAGASVLLGKRDKAVHIHSRDDYVMRLKWIAKKHIVFYDLQDQRAWLLDGASALLHLVRASLRRDKNDPFKELFLYEEGSLQESSTPFTGKAAAIHVLTNQANTAMPLYAKPLEVKVEETTTEIGARSKVLSSTQRDYTLRDRIEDVYEVLEQIISHQADVSSQDGVGFRVKYTMRRQLEGFNFMDVATDEDPLWPRVTTLKARGRGWIDLIRSLHAVTLFGTNFGELLRPAFSSTSCAGCILDTEVPKGQDYLVAPTSMLQEILEKRGSQRTTPWRLVDEIYWHTPDKAFEPCQCKKILKKHDRVQVLLPASMPGFWGRGFRSPAHLPTQGAVLFGHSWRFPLRWKDDGLPEEGEPIDEELDEIEASFHDSGLGTSLDSRSGDAAPVSSAAALSQVESDQRTSWQQVVLSADGSHTDSTGRPPKRSSPPESDAGAAGVEEAVSTWQTHTRPTKRSKIAGGGETSLQQQTHILRSPVLQLDELARIASPQPQTNLMQGSRQTFSPVSGQVPSHTRSHDSGFLEPWLSTIRRLKGKEKET